MIRNDNRALLKTAFETQEKIRNLTDRCLETFDAKRECPPESTDNTTHMILVAIIALLVAPKFNQIINVSLRYAKNTVRARLVCLTKLSDVN